MERLHSVKTIMAATVLSVIMLWCVSAANVTKSSFVNKFFLDDSLVFNYQRQYDVTEVAMAAYDNGETVINLSEPCPMMYFVCVRTNHRLLDLEPQLYILVQPSSASPSPQRGTTAAKDSAAQATDHPGLVLFQLLPYCGSATDESDRLRRTLMTSLPPALVPARGITSIDYTMYRSYSSSGHRNFSWSTFVKLLRFALVMTCLTLTEALCLNIYLQNFSMAFNLAFAMILLNLICG